MFLTATVLINSCRIIVPAGILFSVSPSYYIVWLAFRSLSVALPSKVFKKGDEFLWSTYQRVVLFFFETLTGANIHIGGDLDVLFGSAKNAIYISNHQSDLDWIVSDMLAIRQGCLGSIRYILKNELKMVPLYGNCFYEHGCVYVKRSRGQFNQERMLMHLEAMKKRGNPGWLIIFPEGTRYDPLKTSSIEKSEKHAKEIGLPVLRHHLTPRARATQLSVQTLRDVIDDIYDVTIVYGDTWDAQNGRRRPAINMFSFTVKPVDVYIHFRRIDVRDVPNNEDGIKHWLHQLFVEKDRFVSGYYSTRDDEQQLFLKQFRRSQLPWQSTVPALVAWVGLTATALLTPLGRTVYVWGALGGTIIGYSLLLIRKVS
ncbi:PREDICTED: 1-acyl-sn-glycerol-3-phosphate acyltransferase epsilon-like isoform X1 [Priapulus caudatus]|uniref:1-acyl-sn-glycerol-3-phosphate acyltransferase epsilon-like isoform X1 n=1 Tax=Priapulus caudatus TaxID=37621 RepID=A0ABM1FAR2_PRICU|nr:PREDICTED: 1-acyl-sn-glycerol-3-phosphate acyltransferase epsilon-like isoform X1 [Priapulus caudatus]